MRMRAAAREFSLFFATAETFAASPQEGFPVLAVLVLLDPGVDRAGRHMPPRLILVLTLPGSRGLLRRPLLGQAAADHVVQFWIVGLASQRPLPTAPLGHVLGREVFTAHSFRPSSRLMVPGSSPSASAICF